MSDTFVRPLHPEDDLALLTELIHSAYAPHAAQGLRYWGTHQSIEDTAKRLASGEAFVAERAGQLVGTVTLRGPQLDSPVALYRNPDVWSFVQFAVAPQHKGRGVGKALHEQVLASALSGGGRIIAIDTAAPATALIAKYRTWGYEVCGECDWRPHTNYLSVILSRPLTVQNAP